MARTAEREKEYQAEYYQKTKATKKKYKNANKQEIKEYYEEYYKRNKEQYKNIYKERTLKNANSNQISQEKFEMNLKNLKYKLLIYNFVWGKIKQQKTYIFKVGNSYIEAIVTFKSNNYIMFQSENDTKYSFTLNDFIADTLKIRIKKEV